MKEPGEIHRRPHPTLGSSRPSWRGPQRPGPRKIGLILIGMTALFLISGCKGRDHRDATVSSTPADLVLLNGTVITVDPDFEGAEAVAVRQDRIVAVGTKKEIQEWIGEETEVLDCSGTTVIPGFIEGHGHFTSLGQSMLGLNLADVDNWSEVEAMIADAVKKAAPGEWILGRGWHQEKWNELPSSHLEGLPTHHSISTLTPDNPVCLTHASGHACFFNQKAMELAGVDGNTAAPEGGEILLDETGQPIGIFRETAQGLVAKAHREALAARTPEQIDRDFRAAVRLADQECLAKGVTSFQDAGSSLDTIDRLQTMVSEGEIGTRLWVMIRERNPVLAENLNRYMIVGYGRDHLTVRAIKKMIDGALGPHGAWLLEPYTDLPESRGLNTASVEDVTETARLAAKHGFQLCVHAIGDRANREVLDIFESAFSSPESLKKHRWRVEHAQHLNLSDIPRFAELGVIASMQGVHCTSDAPWVLKRLGADRAEQGAYVWQKLMQSGALVTNGTDAPVEDVSPLASFYATVSRRLPDRSRFFPDQRMSRMEALESYTINCAKAAFEEDIKGSLTPGKLADIVVLSRNLLTVPEDEILEIDVLYTIVGGRILYRKTALPVTTSSSR